MTENTKTETNKSTTRRALGRGLASLISDYDDTKEVKVSKETEQSSNNPFTYVAIDKLVPFARQPRKMFNEEEILGLSESIKQNGIIQALIVRPIGNNYEIIAGERRWRAAKMAGLKEVPVIFREMSDKLTVQVALVENIQRSDLNPIEEAKAYKQLIEEFDMTQDDLSKNLGKERSSIANYLRLLKLPELVQSYIIESQLSTGHAKVLCSLNKENEIIQLANIVVNKKISVRETENYVNRLKNDKNKTSNKKTEKEEMFYAIEDNLRNKFKTKVKIDGKYDKGKFVIEYFNKEDFERILSIFFE
jgi:ParB family transcriptional regulator, chromosome partitioning protein